MKRMFSAENLERVFENSPMSKGEIADAIKKFRALNPNLNCLVTKPPTYGDQNSFWVKEKRREPRPPLTKEVKKESIVIKKLEND